MHLPEADPCGAIGGHNTDRRCGAPPSPLVDRLREKFPDVDPSAVWVLSEGQEPNTPIELMAMIVFGVAAIGGGLYWCWRVFLAPATP